MRSLTDPEIVELVAAARTAEQAWTRAQQSGRRTSAAYKQAFTARQAARRALLAARLRGAS